VENIKGLSDAGVDSPRRDCLVFLEDNLGKDRTWVLTHPEHQLNAAQLKVLKNLMIRRMRREPLAYIRKKAWFFGRFFHVDCEVLIPRPESESFIEILKQIVDKNRNNQGHLDIIDVGTGSGCLAITAKLEIPRAQVTGLDIGEGALALARKNKHFYKVDVEFITSDILTSVDDFKNVQNHSKKIIMLLVNLPYVPSAHSVSPEISFEPKNAIFSGADGLDHYRRFWSQVSKLSTLPQHILTESLLEQHDNMLDLALGTGYELVNTDLLVQHFKKAES